LKIHAHPQCKQADSATAFTPLDPSTTILFIDSRSGYSADPSNTSYRGLFDFLAALPPGLNFAGVITPDASSGVTWLFAQVLSSLGPYPVREAQAGQSLEPGVFLLAPKDRALHFDCLGRVQLSQPTECAHHHPCGAEDITLRSLAGYFRGRMLTILLTGEETLPSQAMHQVRQAGCPLFVQGRSTQKGGQCRDTGLADVCAPPRLLAQMTYAWLRWYHSHASAGQTSLTHMDRNILTRISRLYDTNPLWV
jgi:hypothetical protein